MTSPVYVKEYRGGLLENVHTAMVHAVDENRRTIMNKGDDGRHIFYRSAMKPIQAIPAFLHDVPESNGLTTEETALLTASQRGEAYHQEALERLMIKLKVREAELVCGASYPLNDEPKQRYIEAKRPKRKLLHNCAGKHLGMIAAAINAGDDRGGYHKPDHPVQQKILELTGILAELDKAHIKTGEDGCGLPVHAVPLKNMAVSYLKFVKPEMIESPDTAKAVFQIAKIMNKHPNIIGSHNFICSVLLNDNNIVAKGGAQGVYCFALKKERISFALKVVTGSEHVWPLMIAELLKQVAYSNNDTIQRLEQLRPPVILNDGGDKVGESVVEV